MLRLNQPAVTPSPRHSGQRCVCISMPTAKLRPPYAVRASSTHGRGVFATRAIRKGTRIIEYRGARLSRVVADERPSSDPEDFYHTMLFELSDGTVIDASL